MRHSCDEFHDIHRFAAKSIPFSTPLTTWHSRSESARPLLSWPWDETSHNAWLHNRGNIMLWANACSEIRKSHWCLTPNHEDGEVVIWCRYRFVVTTSTVWSSDKFHLNERRLTDQASAINFSRNVTQRMQLVVLQNHMLRRLEMIMPRSTAPRHARMTCRVWYIRFIIQINRNSIAPQEDTSSPQRRQKNCLHFSICACHPCAGAMLIFSVSFQF